MGFFVLHLLSMKKMHPLARSLHHLLTGLRCFLPAVLMYAHCFTNANTMEDIIRFILVAGEVGTLFKKCNHFCSYGRLPGEIGVSSAMSAAGLTEVLGGSPSQVLMAAEKAMEHHWVLLAIPSMDWCRYPVSKETLWVLSKP